MTSTRQRSRRGRQHPVLVAAGLVLAVLVGLAVLHVLGWLLATAGLAAGAYAIGRNRRPVARAAGPAPVQPAKRAATSGDGAPWTGGPVAAQLAATGAERDQLAARVADLERQLAEARDAAHAAWDAAASRPPAPPRASAQPLAAALLADPLSGVRRLGPQP
jgi:hypothetical protein